jgi:hypothetical protein
MTEQTDKTIKYIEEAEAEINMMVNRLIDDDTLFSDGYTELSKAMAGLGMAKQHIQFYSKMK